MEVFMKRHLLSLLALALSLGLVASSTTFSATNNSHAKPMARHAMFNPSTIETVQGQVAGITQAKGKYGKAAAEWLSLKSDRGTMRVLLGPTSYLNKEKVKIQKGDKIAVTGSRVTMHKKTELVATEVKKGNETLDLRKSDGTPLWSAKAMQGK
jgi:hypothetical protein